MATTSKKTTKSNAGRPAGSKNATTILSERIDAMQENQNAVNAAILEKLAALSQPSTPSLAADDPVDSAPPAVDEQWQPSQDDIREYLESVDYAETKQQAIEELQRRAYGDNADMQTVADGSPTLRLQPHHRVERHNGSQHGTPLRFDNSKRDVQVEGKDKNGQPKMETKRQFLRDNTREYLIRELKQRPMLLSLVDPETGKSIGKLPAVLKLTKGGTVTLDARGEFNVDFEQGSATFVAGWAGSVTFPCTTFVPR